MPLTHFHCPGQPWNWKTIKDCLACDHKCLSMATLASVWRRNVEPNEDDYHQDPKVISVTETQKCPREAYYSKKNDYAVDPSWMVSRTRGTVGHEEQAESMEWLAEKFDLLPDVPVIEQTAERDLSCGYRLMGAMDLKWRGDISDYKFMKSKRKTYDSRNVKQLSIYKAMGGDDSVKRLMVLQEAFDGCSGHEVDYDDEAMGDCLARAEALVVALEADDPSLLYPEGPNIKFFKSCACDKCPHFDECGDGKKTERKG